MSIRGKSWGEVGVGIGLSLLVTVILIATYLMKGFEWLELRTYDQRVQFRGERGLRAPVTLVVNDVQTIDYLGIPPSKVSRSHYAKVVQNLHEAGAALIVLDVTFSGRTNESDDQALTQAIEHAGNVILTRYVHEGGQVVPLKRFQDKEKGEGLINLILDGDGVLRSIPLLGMGYDDEAWLPYLTLGAEAVRLYMDPEGTLPLDLDTPGVAGLGSIHIPYPNGRMLINFSGPPGTFPQLSLWKAVKGEFSPEEVKEKIVIIGGGAPTLHDRYPTPFSQRGLKTLFQPETTQHSVPMMGIEIHANVIETIWNQDFLYASSWQVNVTLIAALGVTCWLALLLFPQGVSQVIGFGLLLIGGVIALAFFLFASQNYWLEMVPLIAVVNSHFAVGMGYQRYLLSTQKIRLERMFSQFVSPQVADLLWSQRTQLLSGQRPPAQTLTVTTLLAKLEDFPQASEKVEQKDLLDWANSYFASMGHTVMKYGGLIEEYGDGAIKAHFGAPVPRTAENEIQQDARQAAQCALAMSHEINQVNDRWKEHHFPPLTIQIAMSTGQAIAGSIGDAERLKYVVLGKPVQIASLIQDWNGMRNKDRATMTRILAGETTVKYLEKHYSSENVGTIPLNDHPTSMGIFELSTLIPSTQEAKGE